MTVEVGDGDGGGNSSLKTRSVAVWWLLDWCLAKSALGGWVVVDRLVSCISGCGLPVGVGWSCGHV